jgi:hypothetical protein
VTSPTAFGQKLRLDQKSQNATLCHLGATRKTWIFNTRFVGADSIKPTIFYKRYFSHSRASEHLVALWMIALRSSNFNFSLQLVTCNLQLVTFGWLFLYSELWWYEQMQVEVFQNSIRICSRPLSPVTNFGSGFIFRPGANPTTASYKLQRQRRKKFWSVLKAKIFSATLKKLSSLLKLWRCSCKFQSRRIGTSVH